MPQSKQIKRQRRSRSRSRRSWGGVSGPRESGFAFYVDFICNSRESRNLHKQIEFCIHFLCPFFQTKHKGDLFAQRAAKYATVFCKDVSEKRREGHGQTSRQDRRTDRQTCQKGLAC